MKIFMVQNFLYTVNNNSITQNKLYDLECCILMGNKN